MKNESVLLAASALVLYLAIPALAAQHGGGFGPGSGKGFGGMPSTTGGEGKGNFGRETGSSAGQASKGETLKGPSSVTDKKTVGDLLTQNTKLSSNLQGILPTGTNLQDAAKGFDNLGQFVAAVHVSHNLDIPFNQLKTEMMNGSSLGEAIHKLRPNVDARQEAVKANQQARENMERSKASNKATAVGGSSSAVKGQR